jgi:hypothetical protein
MLLVLLSGLIGQAAELQYKMLNHGHADFMKCLRIDLICQLRMIRRHEKSLKDNPCPP